MVEECNILITEDGTATFIYSDELTDVFDGEEQTTRRASWVEPADTFGWEQDGWLADMRPSGGPLLYDHEDAKGAKQAFRTRQAALEAEIEWLRKEKGL